jgi:hypothetical protein
LKLGLLDQPATYKDERGVFLMHARRIDVIDLDTGGLVENVAGVLWGPGSVLMDPTGDAEGLFTPEHFDREKDYLVVVVECPHAISVGRPAPDREEEG